MNKTKTLKILNEKIDKMIIAGKIGTAEYNRLCKMHKKIVIEMGFKK